MRTIELATMEHWEKPCLSILPKSGEMPETLRRWGKLRYTAAKRCWYIFRYSGDLRELLDLIPEDIHVQFRGLAAIDVKEIERRAVSPVHEELLHFIKHLELRRYAPSTVQTYRAFLLGFFQHFPNQNPVSLGEIEVKQYMTHLVETRKLSYSSQNQAVNAIKYYFEQIKGDRQQKYDLLRPRKAKTLPTVLSEEEVSAILSAIPNVKHKTLVTLLYAAGLRSGELVSLKVCDLDLERKQIVIKGGKGKKTGSPF
ncbi:site-specific integrase [Pontibacter sp. G13]|nr:site-specific integrase [Pontibacter sp. G13]WNJ18244.1 site-specific integrase [Pontibacter sp. G13]